MDLQLLADRQQELKALGGQVNMDTGAWFFGPQFSIAFVCLQNANEAQWKAAKAAIPREFMHNFITINIKGCSSCGNDHANVRCKEFKGGIAIVNGLPYTHHCVCPVDLDPILVFNDDTATSLAKAHLDKIN